MDAETATIRSATPQDAEALADFLLGSHLFPYLSDLTRGDVVRQLHQKLAIVQSPSHTLLVAEFDARIVGYAAVHWLPTLFHPGLEGYLSELFVAPAVRGRRVGTRLLHAVYDEAGRRGCTRLTLINRRDRDSYRRGFYAMHGWVEQPEAARFSYALQGEP